MSTFVKADSRNLPKVENVMILEYIATNRCHNLAEIRGAKMLMTSRNAYVNTAVGYVQVCRMGSDCLVKAKIVPEHKISKKLYTVTCKINEQNNIIVSSHCDDCAASASGCKHTLLLLFWLEKKSSEPSSTAVTCYWNKPTLSEASAQPVSSKNIFIRAKMPKLMPKDDTILSSFAQECKTRNLSNALVLNYCEGANFNSKNIFDILLAFIANKNVHTYLNFREYLSEIFTDEVIKEINAKTVEQINSKYWHSVWQGRLTASKLHEAANCKTDGALVEQILGGYKVPETKAIKHGKRLESRVLQVIQENINITVEKSGFVLINGILGASPDGVGKDFVLEIKCPASEKAVQSYIKNNILNNKYKTQIMCQMLACKKSKGLFCVADPLFESTKNFHVIWVDFDEDYINNVISKAEIFWEKYIFPKLLSSAK